MILSRHRNLSLSDSDLILSCLSMMVIFSDGTFFALYTKSQRILLACDMNIYDFDNGTQRLYKQFFPCTQLLASALAMLMNVKRKTYTIYTRFIQDCSAVNATNGPADNCYTENLMRYLGLPNSNASHHKWQGCRHVPAASQTQCRTCSHRVHSDIKPKEIL